MNRSKARHSKITLTKSVIKLISSFFYNEENARGIDPKTPIGEIARHALFHWDSVKAEDFMIAKRIASLVEENKLLRSENRDKDKVEVKDEE